MESVLKNGPKWSFISKSILLDRTEHNIKNRFFSLVSGFSGVPVKMVIKERKKYIDEEYVRQVLIFHCNTTKNKIGNANENEETKCVFQLNNAFQILSASKVYL